MQLSKATLKNIGSNERLVVPGEDLFSLPEKVLQFGTGVLLRGLPDYFIDKANRQRVFNGRIVIVKSTGNGAADAFDEQDSLYTLCVRGVENGLNIEENIIHSAISRVISAATHWKDVLKYAANPSLQLIISNTTEVGIVLDIDDDIHASPPRSFPAKLLAFLYRRYTFFNGDPTRGLVIVPTELIPDNGEKLEAIIEELAHQHNLGYAFMDWLENANHFCNSLVDRIVPGRLPDDLQRDVQAQVGYTDELMIMSEAYRLWAIETSDKRVPDILSFSQVDPGVIITTDIDYFRELKLRLLNGSHTFCCGLAYLAGFETVKEAMDNPVFNDYITGLVMEEIAPSITNDSISIETAREFAAKVLDRFRNPHIAHPWLNIALQYSSKMKMRNIPIIRNYLDRFGAIPQRISLGIAAHLLFMKCKPANDGQYYGELNGNSYLVNDDNAGWYAGKWQNSSDSSQLVNDILCDETFWGINLATYPALLSAITSKLQELTSNGALVALQQLGQPAKPVQVS